jgi:outer membrane protein insertion porin family
VTFAIRVLRGLVPLLLYAASAAAQQPAATAFVGRPVASLSLSIEGEPTEEASLKDAIQTKVGAPLSMTAVRETIVHLYAFGRFEDVQVVAESTADGRVALRYELAPIHVVTAVEFHGEVGLPESALRRRMADRFGTLPPLSRQNDVAAVLRDLYRESGYFNATVAPGTAIVQHEPHRATAVFDIHAGAQAKVAKSNVLGHPLESADKVRTRLQIVPGEPYQPGDLQRRLTDYVSWMRHQRYYEASAHEEPASPNADRTSVDVTVNVEPGPPVRVQFEGDPLPSGKKIEDLVPIEREGSVDPDLLEDSARRIKEALNEQGYWKADVKQPEQREVNGELVLVFHITRGAQYRVAPAGLQFTGNATVSTSEIDAVLKARKLALAPGDLFIESRLGTIENQVKSLYRQKGFIQADVTSATDDAGPGLARPVITVKEGTRVTIARVAVRGNEHIPADELMKGAAVRTGDPYYAPAIANSRDQIAGLYLNRGYEAVVVTPSPLDLKQVSTATATSDVTFTVEEGPQTIVDHVFVTGNVLTKPAVILRELQFRRGGPFGQEAVTESRRRLSALGLFRRIQIQPVSHGDPSQTDVVVTVEEAPRTTIAYGGGLQVDRILRDNGDGTTSEHYEFAPRGFFEVGRRNLGGSNRSIDLYSRVSLRPSTTSTNESKFNEYRVVATYREPRALSNYGDLTGTAAVEQGVRTGFNFARKGVNAELTHVFNQRPGRTPLRGSLRYSLSTTRVFDLDPSVLDFDPSLIDRAFPQVRISAFSVALSRDTRDDLFEPQKGSLLSAEGTFAARAIGSEVGYTKTFVQAFVYRNLGKPRLVFAGGARLGLADPFPRPVPPGTVDQDGNPITTIRELPANERFFAGGSTTVRGYAVDTVGVPATITSTGVPTGGDATIVLNAELRAPLLGPVGGVLFVDGGNVYPRTGDLDITDLRGSAGTGLRVRSPIGPIRFDIGFKLDRRVIGGKLESGYAIHISIGQAF